ncbi:MAG: peptide chain release factor 2 [Firmicutes bacterium]|nr:peptide chain release factor 2 [Bacillota bacterium]
MPSKQARLAELEKLQQEPDFWSDQRAAQRVLAEAKTLREQITQVGALEQQVNDALDLLTMAQSENETDLLPEMEEQYRLLVKAINELQLQILLAGPYDHNNAIVTIHSGAGGTESQDWAAMLLRMYTRWAEDRGYRVQILDYVGADEAGIKNATLLISGPLAYGYLRAEKGVHRLVRISPFDTAGRRHTSFASVDVMPEIDNDEDVEISPEDLRIDTYRAGGAGGQHVNKTDSAVRITHIPTGIVVQCQNERSQHANKETAMRMLRAKLLERQLEEQQKELAALRGEVKEIAWGSQIRSYVFHPYSMVKDHRTDVEVGNVQGVMDGDLDIFIDAYLRSPHNWYSSS